MSSLVASLSVDGHPVDRARLKRMSSAGLACGADREGIWTDGCVGLAHRLMMTTPESRAERQPREEAGLCVAADARLDDRDALRKSLRTIGIAPDERRATDDQYILHAYRTWGVDCLPRLLGDFAFALWDAKECTLICARDCFGLRPLYYHRNATRLIVASEIRQLLADPDVGSELNEEVVEDWLLSGFRRQTTATFFQSIRQVPAGHYLRARADGSLRLVRYWHWREATPLRYREAEQYDEHFAEVLGNAVHARQRAIGPVGLLLSGGLDSSSVAAMAAQVPFKAPLRTYSFVYDTARSADEREYIQPLVDKLGFPSRFVFPESHQAFREQPWTDEPEASAAYDPSWGEVASDLRAHDGRVMLAGYGGETILLSQSHYHFVDWMLSARFALLARELLGSRTLSGRWPRLSRRELLQRLVPSAAARWLSPAPTRVPPWWKDTPERRARRHDRWQLTRMGRGFSSLAKQYARELLSGESGAATPWASISQYGRVVGVEYAAPFMDRRLHELVYAFPLDVFFDRGLDRALLRRALKGLLPDAVRLRHKQTRFDEFYRTHVSDDELWAVVEQGYVPHLHPYLLEPSRARRQYDPKRDRYGLIYLALFIDWDRQRRCMAT